MAAQRTGSWRARHAYFVLSGDRGHVSAIPAEDGCFQSPANHGFAALTRGYYPRHASRPINTLRQKDRNTNSN